mmetsp:Transcript_15153/g.34515  ORF Transcript_15153/g.34515 Transcript_15153/m.34515 type:complete len:501 (+) Transcript_15153:47-1549(+)
MRVMQSRHCLSYGRQQCKHQSRHVGIQARLFSKQVDAVRFAVRGAIDRKVASLQRELSTAGSSKPYSSLILGHLSNPQAGGREPITYFRQVLALCNLPKEAGVDHPNVSKIFPADVVSRAREVQMACGASGTGAYTHSQGLPSVRAEIAAFLAARDGHPASAETIYLVNSTSDGAHLILTMLVDSEDDVVLLPAPGYPGWESLVHLLGGTVLPFALSRGTWRVDVGEMERSMAAARMAGKRIRAVMLTNPSNPSGTVMSADELVSVAKLCAAEDVCLLVDEVYQEQVYATSKSFVSAKKAVLDAGISNLRLFSFHSASKGSWAEGSRRGGYVEAHGLDEHAHAQLYKLKSAGLCAGVTGQVALSLLARPPHKGDPSYDVFVAERQRNISSAGDAAAELTKGLNSIDGIACPDVEGGDFAFAHVELPPAAAEKASNLGIKSDELYSNSLLDNFGVSVVPGSAFNAPHDWTGFRIAIPGKDAVDEAVRRIGEHHHWFLQSLA